MTATHHDVDPAGMPADGTTPSPIPSDGLGRPAVAGLVAAAVALGTTELVAGLLPSAPSLVVAIGNGVVELGAGSRVKEIAIALFGTNEKTALVIGTVVLALAFGAVLGVVGRRRSVAVASAGIGVFGLLGVAATTVNPLDSTAWSLVPAVLGVAAGVLTLRMLLRLDRGITGAAAGHPGVGRGRREFLRIAIGMAAVAGVIGAFGRTLSSRTRINDAREEVVLPEAVRTPAPVDLATEFEGIDGLSPFFTPNDAFYRIDTALTPPMVDVASWEVRIHGMVEQEVVLTYQDLLDLPQVEADVTIACVSNEVGGDLIGTARWQGVRLSDVLDMAGVDPAADQLVGRSVDGWTAGFPTDIAFDGRDCLVALAMNGVPLPIAHGFPARLIVPGLYGYVSATKWLSEIELTTWDAFDGYWVPRGWSKEGPVKTHSRIDVPKQGTPLSSGPQVIAGVAWAQQRGVDRVEVSIDDGPWQEAVLADELNVDTWRQWRFDWDAGPGQHVIRVRATDRTGVTQSAERVPVAPNGAEGYHTRAVTIA